MFHFRITPDELTTMIQAVYQGITAFSHRTANELNSIHTRLEKREEIGRDLLSAGKPIYVSLDRREIYLVGQAVKEAASKCFDAKAKEQFKKLYDQMAFNFSEDWLSGTPSFDGFVTDEPKPGEGREVIIHYDLGNRLELSAYHIATLRRLHAELLEFCDQCGFEKGTSPVSRIIKAYEDIAFANPPEVIYQDEFGAQHNIIWNVGDESVGIRPGYEEVNVSYEETDIDDLKSRRDSLKFALDSIDKLIEEREGSGD